MWQGSGCRGSWRGWGMSSLWLSVPLYSLLRRVIGGGTPQRAVTSFWQGSIPWASVKDFTDEMTDLWETKEHISPLGLASSAANLVRPGTPLICTRMAIGRTAIARVHVAINQDLKGVEPEPELIDPRYLLYQLKRLQPKLDAQ